MATPTQTTTGAGNLSAVRSVRFCRLFALWERIDARLRDFPIDRLFDQYRRNLVSRQGRIVSALIEEGNRHE